jgi:hypothetical protein
VDPLFDCLLMVEDRLDWKNEVVCCSWNFELGLYLKMKSKYLLND